MRHIIRIGEWAIDEISASQLHAIDIPSVIKYIELNKFEPQVVSFNEIAHYEFLKDDVNSARFREADPSYPGILVDGIKNPNSLKYRMIDGRHRIIKMKLQGCTDGLFYVLTLNDVLPFIYPFFSVVSARKIEEFYKYNKDLFLEV